MSANDRTRPDRVAAVYRALSILAAFFSALLELVAAEPSRTTGSATSATNSVVLPFEIRRGHVMVPTRVYGSNSLSLLLDTGYTMTMLHPEHVEMFGLKRIGRATIVGIAGEVSAAEFEGPTFDFSGTAWKPRRIAALPSDNPSRSRRRDGILGSGFFRRFVVEIDSSRNTIALHEPRGYQYSGKGEALPITFKSSTPIVETMVRLPNNAEVKAQFEIDTGCDGALCIGKHFMETHQFTPPGNAGVEERRGTGGSTRVRDGHLPQIALGKIVVNKPVASFFLEGSPADAPLAGHIGWDLLKNFKVIFDYSRKQMFLEPKR